MGPARRGWPGGGTGWLLYVQASLNAPSQSVREIDVCDQQVEASAIQTGSSSLRCGDAVNALDSGVLPGLLEERLDMSTRLADVSDDLCRERGWSGTRSPGRLWLAEADPAQAVRAPLTPPRTRELDRLVGGPALRPVRGTPPENPEPDPPLQLRHQENAPQKQRFDSVEARSSPVHREDAARRHSALAA